MSSSRAGEIVIGLDLGTTNAKAAAFTFDGACLAEQSVTYPTQYPAPFRFEQRPADWRRALTDVLRGVASALGQRVGSVVGIGLSAQGPSVIFVSKSGDVLTDSVPTWQDERAIPYGQRLMEQLGSEWIAPGMPLTSFPARLACALAEDPTLADRAAYALGIKDYLAGWLSGRWATEPSSGPGRGSWWPPVFDLIDWPMDRLAPVLPSKSVIGALDARIAAEVGLPAGVPVVIGLNDGASATLGSGLTQPGEVIISMGTNGVVRTVLTERVSPDERLAHSLFCWPFVDGRWIAGGFAKVGASAFDWFVRAAFRDVTPEQRDTLLAEAMIAPPGSHGVLFVPYLAGRGTPDLDGGASASFHNLTLAHQRGDLARAVLEGVAFALRDIVDYFRSSGALIERVRVTGGGMNSPVWRQILADVLDADMLRAEGDATLGAAMMAAVGTGACADVAQAAAAMARPLETLAPRPDAVTVYEDTYREFQRCRDRLAPAVERGITHAV